MTALDLSPYGIEPETVVRNADPAQLYEEAVRLDPTAAIASSGALTIRSGKKTGRSPADKRIVRQSGSLCNLPRPCWVDTIWSLIDIHRLWISLSIGADIEISAFRQRPE